MKDYTINLSRVYKVKAESMKEAIEKAKDEIEHDMTNPKNHSGRMLFKPSGMVDEIAVLKNE